MKRCLVRSFSFLIIVMDKESTLLTVGGVHSGSRVVLDVIMVLVSQLSCDHKKSKC